MAYQLVNGDIILHVENNLSIPVDPGNTDYQEYQAWVAAGNTPLPAPEPPAPPAPLSAAEKLAAAGLSVEELRALLAS